MGRIGHFLGEALNVTSHVLFEPLGLATRWTKKQLGLLRPVRILPFVGYGDQQTWHVFGRVQEHRPVPEPSADDTSWRNLRSIWRRFRSAHAPDMPVLARVDGEEFRTRTDEDGGFDFTLPATSAPSSGPWQEVTLELEEADAADRRSSRVAAKVAVTSPRARFGVVSDIDDTVMYSHATDVWRLIRLTLTNNAHTRVPLPGAAAFYRQLQRGQDGQSENPLFYVSSAAWNLFDLVEDFLRVNGFPLGPLLMREFGILNGQVLRSNHEHKIEKVERIFAATHELPFVLIGDEGQHDPELYHRIACAHPGRVAAVYIRKVGWLDRSEEIARLSDDLAARGVPMKLFDDTLGMAHQAIADGLLPADALPAIEAGRDEDERRVARPETGGGR